MKKCIGIIAVVAGIVVRMVIKYSIYCPGGETDGSNSEKQAMKPSDANSKRFSGTENVVKVFGKQLVGFHGLKISLALEKNCEIQI